MAETRTLALEGEVAAARDAVGRVFDKTLRRLHGLIYEADIHKVSRYVLVQAQQRYQAVRPEGVAPHVHFRTSALFTIAVSTAAKQPAPPAPTSHHLTQPHTPSHP